MEIISETDFVLNTLFLLFSGVLVMFMAAGFAMLEAGSVRSKSVAVILVKNIGLYAISGIMFFLCGYNLMYQGVDGGFIGTFSHWVADDSAAIKGDYSAGYASAAGWFFQMVFVATTASIVSGALAERIKLWPFFIFTALLSGFIYPTIGSWTWGGGWLAEMGFKDFAGSTIVHSVGGWAALMGAIMLGARRGRFSENGKCETLHGASMPQVALGTFILWFGWFGFNGGSQLAIAGTENALAVSKILVNTNMAAAAGVSAVVVYFTLLRRKVDVALALNGALAGLVAITAEPSTPTGVEAMLIGAAGAFVMIAASKALEIAKIDDVVGAVPVHLAAGIFGTIAVCFTNPEASLTTQLTAIAATGIFVSSLSLALWAAMRFTYGIRLHWSHEDMGGDIAELGIRAYNLDDLGKIPKTTEKPA